MKFIDITGKKYGLLTAIQRVENSKDGAAMYLCRCDCGKYKTVRSKHLKSGAIDNCGCRTVEKMRETKLKRGSMHNGWGTRLYRIWASMKTRCYNSNSRRYVDYGGRGIHICDEWLNDFTAFREWAIRNGYQDNLTIDRVDNNKGYSPNNCVWSTYREQNQNRRKRRKRKG